MEFSTAVKVTFPIIALVHVPFSILLVYAMRRARHIPYASKFLATGLIIFDACYISGSTMRKFIDEPWLNIQINVVTFATMQLAYATMAMMSLDRMVVLTWPMDYIRLASEEKIKQVIYGVWTSVVVSFYVVRYVGCWLAYNNDAMFTNSGVCNIIISGYYIGLVGIVQSTSFVSYIVVFVIVKRQLQQDHVKMSFKNFKAVVRIYKSTSMVLIYLIVMTLTSIAYVTILAYIRKQAISPDDIRLVTDIITIVNCFLDPFLYALWYRECRQICKRLVLGIMCIDQSFQNKVHPGMSSDDGIFHIVVK